MKRTLGLFLMVAVLLLASMTGQALAENRAGAFTLSPLAGWHEFEGDQNIDGDWTYGIALGYNWSERWATELFFNYTDTDLENSSAEIESYVYRLDALYHFFPKSTFVPYFAIGVGGITLDPEGGSDENNFLADYGLGVKWFLSENFALRLDARHLMAFDQGLDESTPTDNNLLATGGLTWLFGGAAPAPAPVVKDSDKDGVLDPDDRCPGTPMGAPVDQYGCPLDSDNDGVFDYMDKCPDTPVNATVDVNGCPLDSDDDGVFDYLDKCPRTPSGATVDAKGCPLDSDGDGVMDYMDQCPNTPQGAPVDDKGCALDSDGDGVFDYMDKCPDTPRGTMVDEKGCPLVFTLQIEFDTNKAEIRPVYHNKLKEAADFIRQYPGQNFLIAGHTDSQGSEAYNQRLSENRAEAVRQYLIDNFGIRASRLQSMGFGESQPVAGNETAEGRQQNRRVEVSCCAAPQ